MPAHIAFAKPMDGITQVLSAQPSASELVADAGTSTATAKKGDIARVNATTAVYVAFGPAPTASATNGHYMAAGTAGDFGNLQAGWKMGVTAA